ELASQRLRAELIGDLSRLPDCGPCGSSCTSTDNRGLPEPEKAIGAQVWNCSKCLGSGPPDRSIARRLGTTHLCVEESAPCTDHRCVMGTLTVGRRLQPLHHSAKVAQRLARLVQCSRSP